MDVARDYVRKFDVVVRDYLEMHAGEVSVAEECEQRRLAFVSFILRNPSRVHVRQAQSRWHALLGNIQSLPDLEQLFTYIPLLRPRMSHQEFPPEVHPFDLDPDLLPSAQNFSLRSLAVGSRMRSLSIAAASTNLPNSPAMLITRRGVGLSYALAVA